MSPPPAVEVLVAGVVDRQAAAIARAISIAENLREGVHPLLSALHRYVGRAHRIGITGPPGAGKSTLVDALIECYRLQGMTVGVVYKDVNSTELLNNPYLGASAAEKYATSRLG